MCFGRDERGIEGLGGKEKDATFRDGLVNELTGIFVLNYGINEFYWSPKTSGLCASRTRSTRLNPKQW